MSRYERESRLSNCSSARYEAEDRPMVQYRHGRKRVNAETGGRHQRKLDRPYAGRYENPTTTMDVCIPRSGSRSRCRDREYASVVGVRHLDKPSPPSKLKNYRRVRFEDEDTLIGDYDNAAGYDHDIRLGAPNATWEMLAAFNLNTAMQRLQLNRRSDARGRRTGNSV
jgi:hypothetical protein